MADPKLRRKVFVERVRQSYPDDLGAMMLLYDSKAIDSWVQQRLRERFKVAYPDPVIVGGEEDTDASWPPRSRPDA